MTLGLNLCVYIQGCNCKRKSIRARIGIFVYKVVKNLALTGLGPSKCVPRKDSSSHPGLVSI